nr:hypothetical protein [Streptomyces sp. WAC 06725]
MGADEQLDDVDRGQGHRGAEHDLVGEQAEEERGVAEAAGDRAFRPGGLSYGVAGRQGDDGRGQGGGSDQAEGEEKFRVVPGHRPEDLGCLGRGIERALLPMADAMSMVRLMKQAKAAPRTASARISG